MPNLPISQLPLASSGQPESWMAIVNYDPDPSGVTYKIHFSALTEQFSGATGSSGTSGSSGTDGSSGTSGTDGSSGSSGVSGTSGTSGTSGSSGIDGTSGSSGIDGTSGSSGIDGTSGTSGSSGIDGTSGSSGIDGTSGTSGISGTSGTSGLRGSQWFQGSAQPTGSLPGIQDGDFYLQTSNDDVWTYGAGTWYNIANIGGTSGSSGIDGTSGTSGSSGSSGTSGTDGTSGTSGSSGVSPSYSNPVVFGLFAQTGDSIVVSATTTESTLIGPGVGSLQIPANGFSVGDSFMGRIVGHISSKNNDTIRIRVKTGSVVLGDSGLITMPQTTNKHYTIDCNFTIRAIGIAGVASIVTGLVFTYSKDASNAFEGSDFSTINNTTFDTTVSNTLNITVQWGSTDAQNSIYTEYLVLNKVY